jgi:hypothetical protein
MVRIVGGEILNDDDPRVVAAGRGTTAAAAGSSISNPSRGRSGGATAPPPTVIPAGLRVDWSAPPLRFPPTRHGAALPDVVEVFGAEVPTLGLLAVGAAGLLLGWRGLLGGALLGYLYLSNRPQQQQQQQQQPGGALSRHQAAPRGWPNSSVMGVGGNSSQRAQGGSAAGGSSGSGGSGGGSGSTARPFPGTGRKLGSS